MKYSLSFKKSMVKKLLPPESRAISAVATKAGISDQTLRNWLNKSKEGTLGTSETVGAASRSPREKLNLVIESRSIPQKDFGRWLREKGLHTEHITQYVDCGTRYIFHKSPHFLGE